MIRFLRILLRALLLIAVAVAAAIVIDTRCSRNVSAGETRYQQNLEGRTK